MHDLSKLLADRVASGLKRRTLTKPSRWACACRVMGEPYPGNWTFDHHPWLLEMHDSEWEMNVGQKSAQMGYTETVLNLTFYHIDVKAVDCLYVLPAKVPDASDFSSGRFDRALELSDHLANLFSDVKNVGHKRAGSANLYIRGSRSRSGLKSNPVGLLILDEVDEMDQDNIPLAHERVSGQTKWMEWMLSTPTYPDVGINAHFNDSTQDHFCFKCPHCSKWTELIFPDCLVICGENQRDPKVQDSHIICKECKNVLKHQEKIDFLKEGKWVSTYSDRRKRGFYINQMYSMVKACHPSILAEAYFKGLRDPSDETEFYNSKLGLAHAVAGSQLNDVDLNNHIENYQNGRLRHGPLVTMGVDVGRDLHYEVDEWRLTPTVGTDFNTDARCRVIKMGKCRHFEELDVLMNQFGVQACVVDRDPEARAALQFANRMYGRVWLCKYNHGMSGREINASANEEHLVLVDRTAWLDLALGRFRRPEMIAIPVDVSFEYREHLKCLARVYKKDKNGNPLGYYENFGKDDHFAHARNYAEIALKFAATIKRHVNIQSR